MFPLFQDFNFTLLLDVSEQGGGQLLVAWINFYAPPPPALTLIAYNMSHAEATAAYYAEKRNELPEIVEDLRRNFITRVVHNVNASQLNGFFTGNLHVLYEISRWNQPLRVYLFPTTNTYMVAWMGCRTRTSYRPGSIITVSPTQMAVIANLEYVGNPVVTPDNFLSRRIFGVGARIPMVDVGHAYAILQTATLSLSNQVHALVTNADGVQHFLRSATFLGHGGVIVADGAEKIRKALVVVEEDVTDANTGLGAMRRVFGRIKTGLSTLQTSVFNWFGGNEDQI